MGFEIELGEGAQPRAGASISHVLHSPTTPSIRNGSNKVALDPTDTYSAPPRWVHMHRCHRHRPQPGRLGRGGWLARATSTLPPDVQFSTGFGAAAERIPTHRVHPIQRMLAAAWFKGGRGSLLIITASPIPRHPFCSAQCIEDQVQDARWLAVGPAWTHASVRWLQVLLSFFRGGYADTRTNITRWSGGLCVVVVVQTRGRRRCR